MPVNVGWTWLWCEGWEADWSELRPAGENETSSIQAQCQEMLPIRTAPFANPSCCALGTERLQVPGRAVQGFVCPEPAPLHGALLQPGEQHSCWKRPTSCPEHGCSSCRLCVHKAGVCPGSLSPLEGDKVPPVPAPCDRQVFARREAQTNPPWQALCSLRNSNKVISRWEAGECEQPWRK